MSNRFFLLAVLCRKFVVDIETSVQFLTLKICYVARKLQKVALYDEHVQLIPHITEFRTLRCHWRSPSKIRLFIQIQFLQCACNRDLNKPKYQHLGGSSVR
ncbi:conserved hypothetical protein, partial [Trichinella spiralis]|uniref:hypothetical protein n=1 Tax=Trichinella spiralis TaxID=6334 RepID=UPI0001EFF05C